jgi:hypothetical protein
MTKVSRLPRVIEYRFSKQSKTCGLHSDKVGHRPVKRPGVIRIDPRQTPRSYLDTLLHESIHEFAPYLEEWAVEELADKLEQMVTNAGYHRVYARRKQMK